MNLMDTSSGADLSLFQDASFPVMDIVMENNEDGIPGTVEGAQGEPGYQCSYSHELHIR